MIRRASTAAFLLLAVLDSSAIAADQYAVLVTGATGRDEYRLKYQSWRNSLMTLLRVRFGYPEDHIIPLAEDEASPSRRPTAANVRAVFVDLQRRTTADDLVFVLLTGHGTIGEAEAKFNLVGPDLSADEWAALMQPLKARIVFVDTTSGSFPFLQKLSKPGRVVITATATPMQEYETVFPEYFLAAFGEGQADADKNGRVSIWEAFNYATAGVKKWYEERGQLPTERALLDDTGDGLGREADDREGNDGSVARVTYLRPAADLPAAPAGSELAMLMKRRAEVQGQLDQLRARRATLPEAQYATDLEQLLLELARLDREIRAKAP